jgi:hypothetical protein
VVSECVVRGWNRDSHLQCVVTCIVHTHVTCSRYARQYHHLPSLLYAGEASPTFPPGDESGIRTLTRSPLALCFFLNPGLIPAASTATSITSLRPVSSPVLRHTSYRLAVFVSMSVAHTPCLVTSPPSVIRHHAGKENCIEKEVCKPGTARSIVASTSIHIETPQAPPFDVSVGLEGPFF